MYKECITLLNNRGVKLDDMIEIVYDLQIKYIPNLNYNIIKNTLIKVLNKREVQNVILTGISLDIAVEQKTLISNTLLDILKKDSSLYGVDEVLAYGICNLYGSIALTNFGQLDKEKPKIIGKLNNHDNNNCHVFLDDIVSAIIASCASKLAHNYQGKI